VSLRVVTLAAVAVNAAAAAVSIDRGLPAEWGTILSGDPDNVLSEFLLWRGTAIAPPLPMIVALGVLALLVPHYRLAVWALTVIAGGGILGYLGEPATWELDPVTTPLVGVSIALYALVFGLGLGELRAERRFIFAS
jgi:hypothetical protein